MWSGGDDRRSDEQLLVAAASGTDPEAFGVFYRRHAEAILAYLLRRTRRPELAADVCAETFAHQSSGGEDLGGEPMYAEGAPAPGRFARRTPPGLTWSAGQARADVRSLTFRTPSDVRTLDPVGPAHAFLVVYAGRFPAGSSELVATLRSGREQRSPLFLAVR